jgi:hypothetical protein
MLLSDLLEYVENLLIGIYGIPTYWNMWNSHLLEYVDCLSICGIYCLQKNRDTPPIYT